MAYYRSIFGALSSSAGEECYDAAGTYIGCPVSPVASPLPAPAPAPLPPPPAPIAQPAPVPVTPMPAALPSPLTSSAAFAPAPSTPQASPTTADPALHTPIPAATLRLDPVASDEPSPTKVLAIAGIWVAIVFLLKK